MVSERLGLYKGNVSLFATLTAFQKQRLIDAGFDPERICIIPNALDLSATPPPVAGDGDYCAFVGRVSVEKGITVLLHAARLCPDIPFRLAGGFDEGSPFVKNAPENVRFMGHMTAEPLGRLIRQSRMVVLPSVWFEGFPMTVLESMAQARPVIVSAVGGLGEIVEDERTGFLFTMGDGVQLAQKIQHLWHHPDLAAQMGQQGWEKVRQDYSREKYLQRLTAAYHKVLEEKK
ncbi:MAG TPA: glycosyltransferase family 4 protein, partial [Magnetococcales bacterium]|nr:glycosyltransferase family 4 protein [Magnetococcales bacterium]